MSYQPGWYDSQLTDIPVSHPNALRTNFTESANNNSNYNNLEQPLLSYSSSFPVAHQNLQQQSLQQQYQSNNNYGGGGGVPISMTGYGVGGLPMVMMGGPGADLPPGQPGHLVRGFWSDRLCQCFDSCSICLLSFFCPCIRWSQSMNRLALIPFNQALLIFLSLVMANIIIFIINQYYKSFGWYSYIGPVFPLLLALLGGHYRTKIRSLYDIPGSPLEDCCCHFWCQPCALAQEGRHIDRDFALPV